MSTDSDHEFVGMRFGEVTVLSVDRVAVTRVERGARILRRIRVALYECSCGNRGSTAINNLMNGHTKSCGCATRKRTHGMHLSSEYTSWAKMKSRCCDENSESYKHYGGRGVAVCERWLISFENFYSDMGPKPSPNHSLDRIDVNGNYEPSNCRWATVIEQANNTRRNRIMTIDGVTRRIDEWCLMTDVPRYLIWLRLKRGWNEKDAVFKPVKRHKK